MERRFFLANEDSVGIFATAASFSQLVANNFIACIQSLTLAPIALAIYQDSMQEVRSIFKKNLMVMGAISIILILITYIYSDTKCCFDRLSSGTNIVVYG